MKNLIAEFLMFCLSNKALYRIGTFFYRKALWSGLKQRPRMEKLYLEGYLFAFDLKYKLALRRKQLATDM